MPHRARPLPPSRYGTSWWGPALTSRYWPELDPIAIARDLGGLWWEEIDELAQEVVTRMTLVAEGSSGPLQGRVSSGKPGSTAPHGDRSLADEHTEKIVAAYQADLLDVEHGQAPRRYGWAVLAAATALYRTTHRGRAADDPDPDQAGVERHDAILEIYEGLEPAYAAAIETQRAGYVSPAAIRACRRANARHRETGKPVPVDAALRAAVRTHNAAGESLREIARIVDVGKSTVARILALPDDDEGAVAA